ncbi:MAG: hypothetical protein HY760_00235 [Nitrospirae bacterium]|nr:hypothetical protein [Nitrospirota bacterium]
MVIPFVGFLILIWVTQAFALPSSRRLFEAKYGYKATCDLCHEKGGGSSGNDYGKAFLRAGANFQAFAKIEKKDADGDGVLNLQEIQARSNPGDPRSTPDKPGEWLAEAGKVPIPDKPLKKLFPDADAFAAVEGSLNADQVAFVQTNTGESLTEDDKVPTFYFAMAQGKRYGVAQFIRVEGKKQPISLAVAVDTKGRITSLRVLKSEEDKRFEQEPFLKQFTGKTLKDPLKVGADLKDVPGEEALSQIFAGEVRKALWIVQAVFAKK